MSRISLAVLGRMAKNLIIVFIIIFCTGCGAMYKSNLSSTGPAWQGIIPGKTTRAEVVKILGEPAETRQANNLDWYGYPTQDDMFYNGIGFDQNDIVTAMLIHVFSEENYLLSNAQAEFGEPEKITYSEYAQGTKTYIFASKGAALTAYEDSGVVVEKLYFVPLSLDEFMDTYGRNLPLDNPYEQ